MSDKLKRALEIALCDVEASDELIALIEELITLLP